MQQLLIDQLNLADVVLMNKTDVLPENDLDTLKDRILSYNSRSQMHVCTQGQVELDKVLNLDLFALDKALNIDE